MPNMLFGDGQVLERAFSTIFDIREGLSVPLHVASTVCEKEFEIEESSRKRSREVVVSGNSKRGSELVW